MKLHDTKPTIEIRQRDVSDIMDKRPSGIFTWGISLIAIVLVVAGIVLSDISYTVKFHGIVYALEENDSLKLVARFEPLFAKQMECNTVYQAAFVKNNKVFDAVVVCNRAPTEMILPEYTLLLANNSAINIVDENKSVVLPVGKVIVEYRKVKLINWMLQMR